MSDDIIKKMKDFLDADINNCIAYDNGMLKDYQIGIDGKTEFNLYTNDLGGNRDFIIAEDLSHGELSYLICFKCLGELK